MQTINSGHNVAVVNAKTTHEGWEPWRLINSDANHVILHAQNERWGLGHMETGVSGAKVAVLNGKKEVKSGTNRD